MRGDKKAFEKENSPSSKGAESRARQKRRTKQIKGESVQRKEREEIQNEDQY